MGKVLGSFDHKTEKEKEILDMESVSLLLSIYTMAGVYYLVRVGF